MRSNKVADAFSCKPNLVVHTSSDIIQKLLVLMKESITEVTSEKLKKE